MTIRKTFSDNCESARLRLGLSITDLSKRCGMDRSEVGKILKGKRNISLETAEQIQIGLDVPFSRLVASNFDAEREIEQIAA